MNSRGLLIVQQSYRDRFVSDWTTFSQNKYAAPKRAAPFEKKIDCGKPYGKKFDLRFELVSDQTLFEWRRINQASLCRWSCEPRIRWHLASDLGSLSSRSFYISPNCARLVDCMCYWLRLILSSIGVASFRVRTILLFWNLQAVLICVQTFMIANQ